MMLLVGMTPLALLLLYAVWVNVRFPHVRRIAAREIALNKPAAILTIVGLSISTALITPLISMLITYSESTDRYVRQHLDNIAYEVPAIEQAVLPRHYYEAEDMRNMLRSAGGNDSALLPVISYKIAFSSGTVDSKNPLVPNVLVLGTDMEQALIWDPRLRELDWPTRLGDGRIILSETAASRLNAKAGDVVYALDLDNRPVGFQVDRVVREQGLTGYLGVQRADATAIVTAEAARQLFDLPAGSYTSAVGSSFPAPPWRSVYVKEEAIRAASDANPTAYASFFFGVPILNAFVMSILLTINLFRLIAEERKPGMRTMRTLGFSRLDLKRMLRIEALYYAGLACSIGGLTGTALTAWLVKGYKWFFESVPEADLLLTPGSLFQSALIGISLGVGVMFACMWLVSQRALSYGEMGTVHARERKRSRSSAGSSPHAWISGLLLLIFVFLTGLMAIPSVRVAWFVDGDFATMSITAFLVIVPAFGYAGVRWLEWACRLALAVMRKASGAYGILNLGLSQLKANRVRTGLLLILFCSVSCLASFSAILAHYNGQLIERTDSRTETGGYDYYHEDIRIIDSERLHAYLSEVGYPPEEFPKASSVVLLPWKESDWRGYAVNGIDADYAETNELPLVHGDGREAWRALLGDPDAIVVSTGALIFLGSSQQIAEGQVVSFKINGRTVSKKIVGIVDDERLTYPVQSGIWMNAQEVLRLGKGEKTMHSAVFLRFADIELAREWREETATMLARYNMSPLRGVESDYAGYFRNLGLLLSLFERFNMLALAIGITGLAVVMLRSAKHRRRELGVLRSIGIPPRLLRMYMWTEGLLTGMFGTLTGFAAGGWFAYAICEPQTRASSDVAGFIYVPPTARLLIILAAILLTVGITTYWSTRSVYRVSPIESTKYIPS
ncbi:MAG: FtsX-like permease family protein [Cohnella sp.]|nr:FtsX-like permease family protein [Cohnella sp.]